MTPDVCSALCGDYTASALEAALAQAVTGVSGLDFVKPGMKIGIKANLVSAMAPERAGTVHPMLVLVLSKMLFEAGAGEVVIGDSPGGLFNSAWLNSVYRTTGMQICTGTGAVLNENFEIASRRFDGGAVLREFTGSCWLDEVDAIVNVSKLKTHGMMGMSAAVKNMFGAIPGTLKAEYHSLQRNTRVGESLIYRFYLGENRNNFDVRRNTWYRITVQPTGDGLSEESWRVNQGGME